MFPFSSAVCSFEISHLSSSSTFFRISFLTKIITIFSINLSLQVIAALQFLPRPLRLRNFHYLSIEILQQYVGNPR